jgi:hypothetical protein
MTPNPPSLETELRGLRAANLEEALLTRFEAAAAGTLTQLSPGEIHFEMNLRGTSPARLSPAFLANLESIIRDVPFPVDEKIVIFPKTSVRTHRTRPIWGAAAAVALIGAATAFMIPVGKAPVNQTRLAAKSSAPVTASASGNLTPASFNRGLSEVHDEGVVWKSNNQPHTVVRVVYKDMITLKDANGRTIQVEKPRVEYMLVPAKTD